MRRTSLQFTQLVTILLLAGTPYLFWLGQSYAQQLSDRSITLSTATPSTTVTHTFQVTIQSASAVGSIVFEYCANSPLFGISCTAPPGLSASSAALSQQSGNLGFSIDGADSTATKLIISRAPVAATPVPSSYTFTNITNPSGNNQTTYVRISTYSSSDGSGSFVDNGSVAFTTETNFAVGAFVPPFLGLCVGVTVTADCSQAVGDSLDLGVLSAQATRAAASQFAASTNDVTGYAAYVLGTTMTSGNNIIPAVASPSFSQAGTGQFGLNLRGNSSPVIGADPSGAGSATPTSNYNNPNLFSFVPGSQIANSSTSTDYNRLTVSYIANVISGQPAGIYSTTLTYLVSAQF